MKFNTLFGLVGVIILGYIAAIGLAVYVVIHFVLKFW